MRIDIPIETSIAYFFKKSYNFFNFFQKNIEKLR